MYVIIAGGGRTGAQLARILVAQNHFVQLIDNRSDVLARLHKELPTEVIFEGRPIDPLVLEKAGAEKADVLAACTTEDEVNLAICFMARSRYKVPRTIARINNPR
ncbi:NAD-binding protein, partial [Bellilinea sp.]